MPGDPTKLAVHQANEDRTSEVDPSLEYHLQVIVKVLPNQNASKLVDKWPEVSLDFQVCYDSSSRVQSRERCVRRWSAATRSSKINFSAQYLLRSTLASSASSSKSFKYLRRGSSCFSSNEVSGRSPRKAFPTRCRKSKFFSGSLGALPKGLLWQRLAHAQVDVSFGPCCPPWHNSRKLLLQTMLKLPDSEIQEVWQVRRPVSTKSPKAKCKFATFTKMGFESFSEPEWVSSKSIYGSWWWSDKHKFKVQSRPTIEVKSGSSPSKLLKVQSCSF